jgi:pimeloyl-ACP methyl ester carboxylesterase
MTAAERMRVREWGDGERVAVLVHGITNDSSSWWRLGPALADRGYHVLAPDLTGHGQSAHTDTYSLVAWSDALVASVPAGPELLLGHSLGGLLAALTVDRIRPARAVYVDPAWSPSIDAEVLRGILAEKSWTPGDLLAAYPGWPSEARQGKYDALQRWDTTTLRAFHGFRGFEPPRPTIPSLVLTADPSDLVPPARAAALAADGFDVRPVPGTGHIVHNDDFDGFLKALEGWLAS